MKQFTLERLAHLCMVTFAVASMANISIWLHTTGENVVTSYGVGVACGTVLVVLSVILSKVDYNRSRMLFVVMLCAVVAMCALSGTLQMFAYAKHLELWQAALLGYMLPLAGEAMVGAAMSMYATYQRRELLHNADDATDQRIAEQLADAMNDLDLSKSKEYIQRKVDTLARRKIDATVQRLLAQEGADAAQQDDAQDAPERAVSPKLRITQPTIEQTNDARQRSMEQRRAELLRILRSEGDIGTGAFAQRLECSANTIRNDYSALEEAGRIHKNADDEWVPTFIQSAPQPELYTNGAHG